MPDCAEGSLVGVGQSQLMSLPTSGSRENEGEIFVRQRSRPLGEGEDEGMLHVHLHW